MLTCASLKFIPCIVYPINVCTFFGSHQILASKWWINKLTVSPITALLSKNISITQQYICLRNLPWTKLLVKWHLWVVMTHQLRNCLLATIIAQNNADYICQMTGTLLYACKQLGSAICCWAASHEFQCQTSTEMEALQLPLNNTKTNCFSCFPQEQYAWS